MKKILCKIVVITVLLCMLIVPCSADPLSPFGSDGLSSLTPSYYKSGSGALPPETDFYLYPSTKSGVNNIPYGQQPTYEIYVELVLVDSVETFYFDSFVNLWVNSGKTLPKETYDQYIRFGDPSKQNGNDYVDIEYLGCSDSQRICFNISPYPLDENVNDFIVYKYPNEYEGHQFKLTFKAKSSSLLSDYIYNENFTYAYDPNMYMLPTVTFPSYTDFINNKFMIGEFLHADNGIRLPRAYLRIYRIDVSFGNVPAVYPLEELKYSPVMCIGYNFTVPFQNSTRLDTRYRWIHDARIGSKVMLGTQIGGDTFEIAPDFCNGLPYTIPIKALYASQKVIRFDKTNLVTYSVISGSCDIRAYMRHDEASDGNIFLNWFMRVECGRSFEEVEKWGKGYSDYRLSWCAFSLYKQEAVIQNVATGSTDVQGVNLDSLYQPLFAEWDDSDGILSGIANFFTNLFTFTLPNIFNNFIVWLMCESPLISTFTKPLFLSAVQTKDFVGATLIPLLTTTGVFGVAFAVVLLIKVIVGWLK